MYPRVERHGTVDFSRRLEFVVLGVDSDSIVVSRRGAARVLALREAQTAHDRGRPIVGNVDSMVPYGVFVDLGGVTGLLHVSEALMNRPGDIQAHVRKGDKLEVVVRSISSDLKRISLSVRTPLDVIPRERERPPRRTSGKRGRR